MKNTSIKKHKIYYLVSLNKKKFKFDDFDEASIFFRKNIKLHLEINKDYYDENVPISIASFLWNLEQKASISDRVIIIKERLYLLMNTLGYIKKNYYNNLALKSLPKDYNFKNNNFLLKMCKCKNQIILHLKFIKDKSLLDTNCFYIKNSKIDYYFYSYQMNTCTCNLNELSNKMRFSIQLTSCTQ